MFGVNHQARKSRLECWIQILSTNPKIETAPISCQFSKDSQGVDGRSVSSEDKAKVTVMRPSRLRVISKAMCRFLSQLCFAEHTSADGREAGSGPAQHLALSPARDWVTQPHTCSLREETCLSQNAHLPITAQTPEGPSHAAPGPLAHLMSIF